MESLSVKEFTGDVMKRWWNLMRKLRVWLPYAAMATIIIAVQVSALFLATPFEVQNVKAFENPESAINPLIFVLFIFAFTAFVLVLVRFKAALIHFIILAAVAFTLLYVFEAFFPLMPALLLAGAFTLVLYKYPEWYVVNFVGLLISAGAAAIFGISLAILPTMILLVVLAIYDFLAVYKTKHMVALAESMVSMKVPVLFVVPRSLKYSLLRQNGLHEEAHIMGLGDAVIPTILVVSANVFLNADRLFGFVSLPALFTMLGTLLGYFALILLASKKKAHAGLPFLNSGAIFGFFVGCLMSGVPLSTLLSL
ncbi:presenilin family intramembrane aspartyl protease PSH [Candidatus Alkanophaga liquidiphilum]